jgi:ABC-2 type transport system permease protein
MLSSITAIGAALLSEGHIANPFLFVIAIIAGAFAFSALGMLFAAAAKDTPTANISLTALRLPMIFIGGVFVPVQALPIQLRIISYLTPLTYVIDALREATIAPSVQFIIDLGVLIAWIIILQALAVTVLNKKTQF